MHIPFSSSLPTQQLAVSLRSTSATYKFYWFLAILELVEAGGTRIRKHDLFARMIANAWYTVNYYHVSFGKQDVIQQAIETIKAAESLTIDCKKPILLQTLTASTRTETLRALRHFDKNVPHRFLSPWLQTPGNSDTTYSRRSVYERSQVFENQCPYALYDDEIVINPEWVDYLQSNSGILKDCCYWNLAVFLQTRNPSVPDIPGKLIRPAVRGTLSKQRSSYWNIVFRELGSVTCIFTQEQLLIDDFALDHFIPHAFVSHDLIWNLVPVNSQFNSYKSDRLPSMIDHFDAFFKLQKTAYEIMQQHAPNNKLLEEYLTIFPDLTSPGQFDYLRFRENLQPLITIAHNNGFSYL